MYSIFDAAERTEAVVDKGGAVGPTRPQSVVDRWLMFSDYGAAAKRHMAIVWSCVLVCVLADAVWLPSSRLSFAPSNWTGLLQGIVCCALAAAFIALASSRLRSDAKRPAVALRTALTVTE